MWQFDEVFDQPVPAEGLKKLVDPRFGDNYSFDSVSKGEVGVRFIYAIFVCLFIMFLC